MRYRLDLTLRHAEGALARVLGTAERRGFRPVAVEGETRPDGDRWCATWWRRTTAMSE